MWCGRPLGRSSYSATQAAHGKGRGSATDERNGIIRLLTLTCIIALLFVAFVELTARAGEPNLKVRTSEKIVATWNCEEKIPRPRTRAHSPWKPHSQAFRRWQLNLWTGRLNACRAFLKRRAYEWNWQQFPSWVVALARCESGINWYAEGSSRDGTFYSAFNISRSVYDRDAHHMGVRGWNEGPGVPSPWEQAQAVIGHVRLYGDGFTGRCHGIARSRW